MMEKVSTNRDKARMIGVSCSHIVLRPKVKKIALVARSTPFGCTFF